MVVQRDFERWPGRCRHKTLGSVSLFEQQVFEVPKWLSLVIEMDHDGRHTWPEDGHWSKLEFWANERIGMGTLIDLPLIEK